MKETGILLISCPDKKGIVATVADFLYKNNANILHADEHKDSEENLFFLRIEWEMEGFGIDKNSFSEKFDPIAKEFSMEWKVEYSDNLQNVAIFVSKEEHCLADLLYRFKNKEIFCNISCVISNHEEAKPLTDFYSIPFYSFPEKKFSKEERDKEILEILSGKSIDLVVLARYMQILSEDFINNFKKPIINIHHSFLPSFVGAKPYLQAFQKGVKIIGATSHYVTKDLDQGPIIEQDILRVSHRDSVGDLTLKGKDIEKIVLSRAVKWHLENKILAYLNKTVVFD